MAYNFNSSFDFSACKALPPQPPNTLITIPCPDQLVGHIYNGSFYMHKSRQNIVYKMRNGVDAVTTSLKSSRIVIILESPHIKEFTTNPIKALGPAMGRTGTLFEAHFDTLLKNSTIFNQLSKSSKHDVIFLNSVQYQCSLGQSIQKYRNRTNKIWIDCFNTLSTDLVRRINALKPTAVINLCTSTGALSLRVESVLKPLSLLYTRGTHPASWRYPTNRYIV